MRLPLALPSLVLAFAFPLVGPSDASADDGMSLYEASCAKCHGADGKGETTMGKAMKAKSLVDPKWAAEDSTDAVVSTFHSNPKHKSVASKVSDDDLRAIAAYIRKLASGGK